MLPSDPVTVNCVALVAVTVKVDEFPETIEAGLAVKLIVGAGVLLTPRHPLNSRHNTRLNISLAGIKEKACET